MNNAIEVTDLTRRHKSSIALDGVSVSLQDGVIPANIHAELALDQAAEAHRTLESRASETDRPLTTTPLPPALERSVMTNSASSVR